MTTERSAPGSAPALELLLVALLLIVGWAAVDAWPTIASHPMRFVIWTALLAAASLCTFSASRRQLVDVSFGGAVAVVIALRFDPAATTAVVFIGSVALREVQGRAPWRLAAFNRAQTAVAAGLASYLAGTIGSQGAASDVLAMVFVAASAHYLANGLLSGASGWMRGKLSWARALRQSFGPTWSAAVCYIGVLVLAASVLEFGVGQQPASLEMGLLFLGFAVAAVGLRAATQAATARDELRDALAHSLRSARDDRAAIGRYLHDEAMQSLSAASVLIAACRREMGAAAPERLREAEAALRQSVASARDLLGRVAGPTVPEGLGAAVARELLVLEAFGVETVLHDDLGTKLDEELEGVMFGAIREGLRNVRRHAEAQRVEVSMRRRGGFVEATVTDDGRGLGWPEESPGTGYGIVLLRETVRGLGGTVTLADRRGDGGAELAIRLPERRAVELAQPPRR